MLMARSSPLRGEVTPWACSRRFFAACQANAPCELALALQKLEAHPDSHSGERAQSRAPEDSGTPQPREGILLAPTCLCTQQLLLGQYDPSTLLLSHLAVRSE